MDLDPAVHGTLPIGLSGQLLAIGPDGVAHSIELHDGQVVSYKSRSVVTDPDTVASNIIDFGGSILALGQGSLAYELTADLDMVRRVDLAGQHRGLAAFPKRDPVTGDLHVIATAATGTQAHVVVSSGALTRRNLPIHDAPDRVTDLAITGDRVVYVTDHHVGVRPRHSDAEVTWRTTGVPGPRLVDARDVGTAVVMLAATPALERWTLHATLPHLDREVVDPTLGRMSDAFLFVADPARARGEGNGWRLGFVHPTSGSECDLVVLDAADMAGTAIATVRIPRLIPTVLHTTWIPSTQPTTTNEGTRP